jgi:hypothetical protein
MDNKMRLGPNSTVAKAENELPIDGFAMACDAGGLVGIALAGTKGKEIE